MRLSPPNASSFSCGPTQTPIDWQELKEALAHAISNRCCSSRHLRQLHARVISSGLRHNLHLSSLLINRYFSFRDVETARRVFDCQNPRPTKTLLWNVLIRGYLRNGRPRLAVDVYREMTERSPRCAPDRHTFNLAITACTSSSEFELGSCVGAHARSRGLESDLLVATALVGMYCGAGDLGAARDLFDRMTPRDAVSWNAMISGYSRNGYICEAMRLFKDLLFENDILPTEATMVSLVSVCGDSCSLKQGEGIHAHVIRGGFEADQFVCNALMKMYIECDCLDSAARLFEWTMMKDAVSWSTMIGGYVRHGCSRDAIKLFHQMVSSTSVKPTRPILLNVILACANLVDLQRGELIELEYLRSGVNKFESDACLSTALIYMYAKCGKIEISLKLLEEVMPVREDVIAWNALIKACGELGDVHSASVLMLEMQRKSIGPDAVTFLMLLSLFSSTPLLRRGMEVHAQVIKRGFGMERSIANSLIDMYAKCGNIEDSREIFNGIQDKDVVSWSSILKGYAWNGSGDEVLDLFQVMRETVARPNDITFVAVLSACSHAGYVEKGRELFKCMKEEYGLEPSLEHYACMVDLFCRAGLLSEAFDLLENGIAKLSTSAVLWGILLSACRVQDNWLLGEAVARHLFYLEPRNAANYVVLANIYISAGRREDANKILRSMRDEALEKSPGFSWFEG